MATLEERTRQVDWYHTLSLGQGVVTEGQFDLRGVVDRYRLPESLDGLRVLDVGTFDGFWAFEMERRGAAEIVALDVDHNDEMDWPRRHRLAGLPEAQRGDGFRLAKEALGSRVERVSCSIYDARPESLGRFDFVFCASVLIHLRDQLLALERIAALTTGTFVSVEAYNPSLNVVPFPMARYRANRDRGVVFWEPSVRAWKSMLYTAGFDQVDRLHRFRLKAREGWTIHHVVHRASRPVA